MSITFHPDQPLKDSQLEEGPQSHQITTKKHQLICEIPFLLEKPGFIKYQNYLKNGHWSKKEKLKYAVFIQYHKTKFINRGQRRLFKVFKAMSDFIKTRNPDQCRSFHQKMEKNFVDIQQVIESAWGNFNKLNRQKLFLHYKMELFGQQKQIKLDEDGQEKQMRDKSKEISNYQYHISETAKENQEKLKTYPPTAAYPNEQKQKQLCEYFEQGSFNDYHENQTSQKSLKIQCQSQERISLVPFELLQKKEKLVIQCHSYWVRWLSTALQLEQTVQKQKMIRNQKSYY